MFIELLFKNSIADETYYLTTWFVSSIKSFLVENAKFRKYSSTGLDYIKKSFQIEPIANLNFCGKLKTLIYIG